MNSILPPLLIHLPQPDHPYRSAAKNNKNIQQRVFASGHPPDY
jgi:hypothetical protein